MEQNTLDQIDRSLKHKPAPVRKESKADRIMKRLFDDRNSGVTIEGNHNTIVDND